jgi:hypothetical protein
MSTQPWRWLRPPLLASIGLLLLALPPLAQAAPASSHRLPAHSGMVAHLPLAVPAGGPHFLYLDDGDPLHDGIVGYQITRHGLVLTPGSPYRTGGTNLSDAFGINVIATSTSSGACLFHSDGQSGGLSGQVESFRVNRITGALAEGSIVPLPYTYTTAGDIHVSADGRDVYVAIYPVLLGGYTLDVLTIDTGCSLALATTLLPANGYFSIALVGSAGLLWVGTEYDKLDMYRITNGTQLTLVPSTPSQVVFPLGAAVGQMGSQTYTFNSGGVTNGPGESEAHTVNGQGLLGNVPGSPAVDSNGHWGGWVWFDPLHQQVIESESGGTSLTIYGAKGGALALLGRALVVGGGPEPMVQLGTLLFVDNGAVNTRLLSFGAATCRLAATLPNRAAGLGIGVV